MTVSSPFARALAAGAAALALCACGQAGDDPAAPEETPAAENRAPSSREDAQDDGLAALTADEIRGAALGGELSCGFFGPDDDFPLLTAMGVVGSDTPAEGVVKAGGAVVGLSAPGGFDAMLGGAVFTGSDGADYAVAITGPAQGGGESPARPGTLTAEGGAADGEAREGSWVCGP